VPESDRLREQYAEADRLMREAQRAAEEAAAGEVPPRGWSASGADRAGPPFDLSQLTALVDSLRGAVPPELTRRLADALRELLLAVRAILDWYIARLEPPEGDREVEDIPVE
jgi:hypothetical protein